MRYGNTYSRFDKPDEVSTPHFEESLHDVPTWKSAAKDGKTEWRDQAKDPCPIPTLTTYPWYQNRSTVDVEVATTQYEKGLRLLPAQQLTEMSIYTPKLSRCRLYLFCQYITYILRLVRIADEVNPYAGQESLAVYEEGSISRYNSTYCSWKNRFGLFRDVSYHVSYDLTFDGASTGRNTIAGNSNSQLNH
jgi:hypothetical protein